MIAIPPARASTSAVTTIGSTITAIFPKSIGTLVGGVKKATGSPVTWRPVMFSNVLRLSEMIWISVDGGMRGSPVEVVTGICTGTNTAIPTCVVVETDTIWRFKLMVRSTVGTSLMSKMKILALVNSVQNCSRVPQLLYRQKNNNNNKQRERLCRGC